jgi:hypothetical protein
MWRTYGRDSERVPVAPFDAEGPVTTKTKCARRHNERVGIAVISVNNVINSERLRVLESEVLRGNVGRVWKSWWFYDGLSQLIIYPKAGAAIIQYVLIVLADRSLCDTHTER